MQVDRQRRHRRGGLPPRRRAPARTSLLVGTTLPDAPGLACRHRDAPPLPRPGHHRGRRQRERRRALRRHPGRGLGLLRQGHRRGPLIELIERSRHRRVRHQRATARQALRRRPRPGAVPLRQRQRAGPDQRLRPPDRPRAGDPAQGQRRADQRRDRLRPRHQRPDGQEPRHLDPAQAGRQRPHPGRRHRPQTRLALDRRDARYRDHRASTPAPTRTSSAGAPDRAPRAAPLSRGQ